LLPARINMRRLTTETPDWSSNTPTLAERALGIGADDRLAVLAHELRGPLHVMRLNVDEIVRRMRQPTAEASSDWLYCALERQQRVIHTLHRLTETLLESRRHGERQLELIAEWVDLREIVRDVLQTEADAFSWAGCRCSFDAPSPVLGYWEPSQLRLAVTNLIGNALKFGSGHPVEVAVGDCGNVAWLRVSDRGVGIRLEDQERIFERFERGSGRRTGFGLGLWLVKNVVLAHGGNVLVGSAPGQGASFLVALPRSPGEAGYLTAGAG
jgi:signal transduction histidine kinase